MAKRFEFDDTTEVEDIIYEDDLNEDESEDKSKKDNKQKRAKKKKVTKTKRKNKTKVKTKVTAAPIPTAVSTFLDTPKNGHIPKNCDVITLLTSTILKNKRIKFILFPPHTMPFYFLFY